MQRLTLVTPPGVSQTGTLAAGSPAVSGLASTAAVQPGQRVTGPGVPTLTLVLSVDSASQVTLTNPATATGARALFFAVEPVTVAEVVRQVRNDFPDEYPDHARRISMARAFCEKELRQAVLTQTVREHFDCFPWGGGYHARQVRQQGPTTPFWLPSSTFPIPLMMPPVQSIVSVTYYDYANTLNTIDPSLYVFEVGTPSRIAPVYGQTWPVAQPRPDAIQVTYVVGHGDTIDAAPAGVSETIREAILVGVAGLYFGRGESGSASGLPETAMKSILSTLDHGSYA